MNKWIIIGFLWAVILWGLGIGTGIGIAVWNYKPEVIKLLRMPADSVCRRVEISGQPGMQCCYFNIEKEVK